MTQIKVSKILDIAKYTATKAGSELADFLLYVSELADQTIRILRNGITFTDNVDCSFLTVNLATGVTSAVNVGSRRPKAIWVAQVVSVLYGVDTFRWYIDGDGSCKVIVNFTGSPAASQQIPVVLLILYG